MSKDTLEYLNSFLLPALIVVWEGDTERAYYTWADDLAHRAGDGKTVRVEVSSSALLTRGAIAAIADRARQRYQAIRDALAGSGAMADLLRTYHELSEVQDILVDYAIDFATARPENMAAAAVANFGRPTGAIGEAAERIAAEYRVDGLPKDPIAYPNLLLASVSMAILEFGNAEASLRSAAPRLWAQTNLGIPYLRKRFKTLVRRATTFDPDEPHREGVDVGIVDAVDLCMGCSKSSSSSGRPSANCVRWHSPWLVAAARAPPIDPRSRGR